MPAAAHQLEEEYGEVRVVKMTHTPVRKRRCWLPAHVDASSRMAIRKPDPPGFLPHSVLQEQNVAAIREGYPGAQEGPSEIMNSSVLAFQLQQEQELQNGADRYQRLAALREQESFLLAQKPQKKEGQIAEESFLLAWDLRDEEDQSAGASRKLQEEEDQKTEESIQLAWKLQEEEDQKAEASRKLQEDEDQKAEESIQLAWKLQAEEDQHLANGETQLRPQGTTHLLPKHDILLSLHPCQRAALDYVRTRAKRMHMAALPALKKRVDILGYDEEALQCVMDYIRDDAPIIIHLKEETLALLVQDTHYRSLFETHSSGDTNDLTSRESWEACLFGKRYDKCKKCEPYMRPKYGCLNVSGDIAGVFPARHYGELYMTLASSVRHRATFSDADTGENPKASLATNDWYAHVLARYPDDDLHALLRVVQSDMINSGTSSKCGEYKEVQIHGTICLATDVQALSVPGWENLANLSLRKVVEEFQEKTRCNILWQDDLG